MALEAYLDESITKGDDIPMFVLGGYVAQFEEWIAFSDEWAAVLNRYGLEYFHAKDLKSGNAKLYRHIPYDKRRSLLVELSDVICQHSLFGVSLGMSADAWNEITVSSFRSEYGSAYGFAMSAMLIVLSTILARPKDDPAIMSIFLESGHANAVDALDKIRIYKRDTDPFELFDIPEGTKATVLGVTNPFQTSWMRIQDLGLVDKRSNKPVQAADLFSYLVGAASRPPIHKVFDGVIDRLAQAKPHFIRLLSREDVRMFSDAVQGFKAWAENCGKKIWRLKNYLRSLGVEVSEHEGTAVLDIRQLDADQRRKLREALSRIVADSGNTE